MIELVMIVCALGGSHACKEVRLQYAETSVITCALGAPPILAQWVAEHPQYRVARWGCAIPGQQRRA